MESYVMKKILTTYCMFDKIDRQQIFRLLEVISKIDSEFGGEQPDSSKKPRSAEQICTVIIIIQVNNYNQMRVNIICVFIN